MEDNLFKTTNALSKLFLSVIGCLLILLIVVWFNTFSPSREIRDFNNFYWIVFYIFTLFSFIVPVLVFLASVDMYSLNSERVKDSKKYSCLWKTYKQTFLGEDPHLCPAGLEEKTRANADLYFGVEEIISSKFFNLPIMSFFKNMSGTFVGMGILGTFMGFAQFLSNIIEGEMNFDSVVIFQGLKIAFNTSIIGLFSSIVYTIFIYYPLEALIKYANRRMCDVIDKEHYISDERCMRSLSQIIETTEMSIDKNFKQMCEDISKVISEERKEFTDQVLGTAELLKKIDESLGEIPFNVQKMSDELNNSIELAKTKTLEMSNECITTVNKELTNVFSVFANRFDESSSKFESAATEIEQVPNNFKNSINDILTPIKNSFENLEKDINANLKEICSNTIKDARLLFETEKSEISKINTNLISNAESNLNKVYESIEHRVNAALKESTATLGNTISQSCSEFTNSVDESLKMLSQFSIKTGEFTDEYKLLQVSLSEMTQKILESKENVVSGTEEIKNVLLEFIKTALLMEETQKVYKELADSLKFLPTQHKELQKIYKEGADILRDSLLLTIKEVLGTVTRDE